MKYYLQIAIVTVILLTTVILFKEEVFVFDQVESDKHHEEHAPVQIEPNQEAETARADFKSSKGDDDSLLPSWLSEGVTDGTKSVTSTVEAAREAAPEQASLAVEKAAPAEAVDGSPDTVLSALDTPGSRPYALGTKVVPPLTTVAGCRKCPPVKVPAECSQIPVMKGTTPSGGGARKLLAGPRKPRQRTAFQSADRTVLAKSRQPDFNPPDEALRNSVAATFRTWHAKTQNGTACGFWTKDCVLRHIAGEKLAAKGPGNFVAKGLKLEDPEVIATFPDEQPGGLGSCAVVAVADNMLGKARGVEIDEHDTVFRYNGPMKAYARDVGTKGDVYYWKQRRDERQYGVEGQAANKYYMWKSAGKYWLFASKKEIAAMTFKGKQILWETGLHSEMDAYGPYHRQKGTTEKHSPSGGYGLALTVIASGLCKRVDLYGFSSYGGGRYFKNAVVNTVHSIGLEHWVYRVAMEEGLGVCVYD